MKSMLDDKAQNEVKFLTRTTTVIVSALCGGIVVFAIVVLVMKPSGEDEDPAGTLTYASIGLGCLQLVLATIVPRVMASIQRKQVAAGMPLMRNNQAINIQTDAGKLAQVYQTTTIVGCALLESAAFLALLAYLLEGQQVSLAVAGAMLLGVAAHLPIGGRLASWVERQLKLSDEEQQLMR